jgi:hypothetical protein
MKKMPSCLWSKVKKVDMIANPKVKQGGRENPNDRNPQIAQS